MQNVPFNKKALKTRGLNSSYQIWLKQKQQSDQKLWNYQSKYWVINNKIYDLTHFIDKHPGGSNWIKYTKGQQITEQYMVHHLNIKKADQVLSKYYVKDCQNIISTRYTFQQQGLYETVKKRMLSKFTINQLQDCSKTQKIGLILFSVWLFCFVMSAIYESYILAIFCGYLMLGVTGIAHNFIHMKPHPFKYFYLVTGFTPKQWQIMHCLSHHQYTNTLLDYQIQVFEPLAYFLKILPRNTFLKIILVQIIYIIMVPSNIILKLIIVPLTKFCKPQFQYLVPLLQMPILYCITENILTSFYLFLTIHCFFGFVFAKVTFGGHRIQKLWTQGQKQVKDFGQHALYTCNDIYPHLKGGFLSFLFVSGFNIHVVHHMFPTIDNQHLWKVDQILKEVCQQRNLKKNSLSLFKSIQSVFRNYWSKKLQKQI